MGEEPEEQHGKSHGSGVGRSCYKFRCAVGTRDRCLHASVGCPVKQGSRDPVPLPFVLAMSGLRGMYEMDSATHRLPSRRQPRFGSANRE